MVLHKPSFYKQYERSPLDGVYKALRNKDLADCVLMAIRVLKENNNFIKFENKEKSFSEALQLGMEGKKAFCEGGYQIALFKYNLALMRAPPDSEPMRLTYYSRAELLLKTKQFSSCVKDIDTCLALSCADSLVNKLREMRAIASQYTWIEQLAWKQLSTPFVDEFFKLKVPGNPDIPCASSDVEVIMESGQPKVVATRDIPVGTVVAVETAFTATTHFKNQVTSCHYCLKMDFNLIPCEGCCTIMFCDKRCKDKAMQEGHNIECKILHILMDDIKPAVQATLKIRHLCSSWDEFITASNDLGADRMNNSTFAEIFGSEKFSLLNSHYDTHFIYGALFNQCMYLANIIHYLDTQTSFLPKSPEDKSAAIRAVSRVMMHLSMFCTPVNLQHHTAICTENRTRLHNHSNKGYFPFIGNLANSCLSNCYVMALRNSAALVTLAPVKKGAELTITYIGHWLETVSTSKHDTLRRAKKFFMHYRTVCKDCIICSGCAVNTLLNVPLNDTQKKAFEKFSKYYTMRDVPQNMKTAYRETCNILLALSDAPCSEEYAEAYVSFIQCLLHVLQFKFPNIIMNQYE